MSRCPDCGSSSGSGAACSCDERTRDLTVAGPSVPGHRILGRLGEGGMGQVYLAEDEALGRRVAIKTVASALTESPEACSRFLREAQILANVEHPNVVRVYAFGEVEGQHYLVMEHVDGKSLGQRIKSGPRIEGDEALRIVSEIAEGLDAAWREGIIHRDIKPANILLDASGRVRVADFGLAKLSDPEESEDLTRAGGIVGTPQYLSPEQARGDAEIDCRSDIYSLGLVLYEMLTGSKAFTGSTPLSVMEQQLNRELPSLPPEFSSPGLTELLGRMTCKDPKGRVASYGDLRQMIVALRSAPGRKERRFGWKQAGLTLLLIAISMVMGWKLLDPTVERIVNISSDWSPEESAESRLQEVFWVTGLEVEVQQVDSTTVSLVGHVDNIEDIDTASSLVPLIDSLASNRFLETPSSFLGGANSDRLVDLEVHDIDGITVVETIALAAGWPLVIDHELNSQESRKDSFNFRNLPWDVVADEVLVALDLQATRFDRVWLVASSERSAAVLNRLAPAVVVARPRSAALESMAQALDFVKGDHGVVAVNRRLQAIVIVDRIDRLDEHARAWSALEQDCELTSCALPVLGQTGHDGLPMTLTLGDASALEVFNLLGSLAGVNIIPPAELGGSVSVVFREIPWDNALEVLAISQGLEWHSSNDGVIRLRSPDESSLDLVVETIRTNAEPAAFFKPFEASLTSNGSLDVESDDHVVLIQDERARAVWLRELIRTIDTMTADEVPTVPAAD